MPQKSPSPPEPFYSAAYLNAQAAHWQQRLEDIAAKYYQAQADFHRTRDEFHAARQERRRLRGVVQAKQHVIEVLLPYYPHPLTPEMQHAIDLV